MFRNILVPTDGSSLSDKALDAALQIAKASAGKIIGLAVAEPYPFSPLAETAMAPDQTEFDRKALELAHQHLKKVSEAARNAGVPCETITTQSFSPYEEIIALAKKSGCDLICMASHGRKGLNRLFLGSETQKVLTHSSIPVLVLR